MEKSKTSEFYENIAVCLTGGLACGLAAGLTVGLVCGLTGGLVAGLACGLVAGLVVGFAVGLTGGLACGIVVGLVCGLTGGLAANLACGLVLGLVFNFPPLIPFIIAIIIITELLFWLDKRQPNKKDSKFWHTLKLKTEAIIEALLITVNFNNIYYLAFKMDWTKYSTQIETIKSFGGILLLIFGIIGIFTIWVLLNSIRYQKNRN